MRRLAALVTLALLAPAPALAQDATPLPAVSVCVSVIPGTELNLSDPMAISTAIADGSLSIVTVLDCATMPSDTPAPIDSTGDGGAYIAKVGEPVGITCSDADCLKITVSKVAFKNSYHGSYGSTDKPKSGNVYLQFFVTYEATGPDADYNEYDWTAYVDGETNGDMEPALVFDGPSPALSSGNLRVGKRASGWVVLEVPAQGHVAIAYADDVFEVNVR